MKCILKNILICSIIAFYSCSSDTISQIDGSIENFHYLQEQKHEKGYLVLLTKPECTPCLTLIDKFKENRSTYDNIPIYIVNTDNTDSQWWVELLYITGTPIICYFSPSNQLAGVFQGTRKEALETLAKTIKGEETYSKNDFYSSRIKDEVGKESTISFYNTLFDINRLILEKKDASDLIRKSLQSYENAYIDYLASINKQQIEQRDSAIYYAHKGLEILDPYSLIVFNHSRIKMNKIIDPTFDIKKRPLLKTPKKRLYISNWKVQDEKSVSIDINNNGIYDLIIYDVFGDCDCMDFDWDSKPIEKGKSTQITVKYTAAKKGQFNHEIYISSNAKNPMEILHLSGIIKE